MLLGSAFPSIDPAAARKLELAQMNQPDHRTEEAVRRFLRLLAGRYDMAGAVLFGSRARGTHQPDSDADVAVLLRGDHQRFLPTKLAMADVAFDVLLETGINISPLPVWLDEWEHPERFSNPALLQNIAREGVPLWPAD
jgi:predicted nucleotidyltransferase